MVEAVFLGAVIDPESGAVIGEKYLYPEELESNVLVYGPRSYLTSQALAMSAWELGYDVLVIDLFGRFRGLAAVEGVRLLKLGDTVAINPMYPEGLDGCDYAELLTWAFAQSYRLSDRLESSLKASLISLYESQPSATPTLETLKAHLEEEVHVSLSVAQRSALAEAFAPLFRRALTAFVEGVGVPLSELAKGLTVVSAEDVVDLRARTFVQAVLLAKALAWARSSGGLENKLFVLDCAEALFANRSMLPTDKRDLRRLLLLEEAQVYGLSIALCGFSICELDPLAAAYAETKVMHVPSDSREWSLFSQWFGLSYEARSFYRSAPSKCAVLRSPVEKVPILVSIDWGWWLLTEPPSYEELRERMSKQGLTPKPPEEPPRVWEDFGSLARVARDVLAELAKCGQVSKLSLLRALPQHDAEDVLWALRELERRRLVTTRISPVDGSVVLSLTELGRRAFSSFEEGGLE